MNLADELTQLAEDIDDGRVLYRHLQYMKREGAADQEEVNCTLDDVESLIRRFNLLLVKAKAEAAGVEFSQADHSGAAVRAQERIRETAERVYDGIVA